MDVQRLIELLPLGLYNDDPETRRILAAMLEPVAKVDDYFTARTAKLGQLLDPAAVPDEQVPYLAAIVGIGLDLPAANAATVAELRKLIPVAVRLWKLKGTRPSWRALPAALAGSRSLILDWFALRTISGSPARVAVIPGPGGTGYPYTNPEYVTDLWIMDPSGSGVNLELLARFLDVVRGNGERINLYRAFLVDDLGAGAGMWADAATGSGSWSYNSTTWELTARDGKGFRLDDDLSTVALGWTSYHATWRLAVTGTVRLRWRSNGTTSYRIVINAPAGTVQLQRVVAGVPTVLSTFTGAPLVAGFPYLWATEAWEGSGSTRLVVYREGAKLIDIPDNFGGRPSSGGLRWDTVGPGSVATLSTALVWPDGIAPTRVGPTP